MECHKTKVDIVMNHESFVRVLQECTVGIFCIVHGHLVIGVKMVLCFLQSVYHGLFCGYAACICCEMVGVPSCCDGYHMCRTPRFQEYSRLKKATANEF